MAEDRAAEYAGGRCIDCFIRSTYVAVPGKGFVHIFQEADVYGGDQLRQVRVEHCSALTMSALMLECTVDRIDYTCSEPL